MFSVCTVENIMKTYMLVCLTALVAFVSPICEVRAEDNNTPSQYSWSVNALFMSKYYGSIVGGIFYDGPMSFTGLTLTRKDAHDTVFGRDGANRASVTIGQKLDDSSFDVDSGNEYDFAIGRSATLGPEEFPIQYDAGITFLVVHPLGHLNNDVLNPAVTLSLPKMPLVVPYVTVYQFEILNGNGSGTFLAAGIRRSQELSWLKVCGNPVVITGEYRFGWALTDGLFGSGEGPAYHRLIGSATAKLSKHLSTTFALTGQASAGGQGERAFADRTRVFAEGSLRWDF
jgi:hypothetical protein